MISVQTELEEKITESSILLNHLQEVENKSGTIQTSAILKSSFVVLLYNIIESTTRVIFEVVHDNLSQYTYNQLSEKSKTLFLNFYFNNHPNKTYKKHIDEILSNKLTFPILDEYTKKISLFSGNLDARFLNDLLKKYGINPLTCNNRKDLLRIKNKRNKLAHGEESFINSCRGFLVRDLIKFQKAVHDTMMQLITNTKAYLENKSYLE